MKWLICLLSCYVLLLSGVPCSAEDHCCQEEQAMQAQEHPAPGLPRQYPPCFAFFCLCGLPWRHHSPPLYFARAAPAGHAPPYDHLQCVIDLPPPSFHLAASPMLAVPPQ